MEISHIDTENICMQYEHDLRDFVSRQTDKQTDSRLKEW